MSVLGQKKLSDWMADSFLLAKSVDCHEHRANPFLNILNVTSKMEEQYPDLLGNKSMFWRVFHSLASAFFTLMKSFIYWPKKIPFSLINTSPDVLIISHLTNLDHLSLQGDFYFGDLQKVIEKNGLKTHRLLINHVGIGKNEFSTIDKTTILPRFLSPIEEAGIILKLFFAAFKLKWSKGKEGHPKFLWAARLAQFNNRAMGDFRIGTILTGYIRALEPKAVVHTYEGHGWERIVDADGHLMPQKPLVLGYQHAVVFPGQKSILCNYGTAMPDHIFTSGLVTKKILVDNGELPEGLFSVLGSIKAYTTDKERVFDQGGACLIAPEGNMSEVRIMACLAIEAARKFKSQRFILRLHPVLKKEKVLHLLRDLSPLPKNFSISGQSLKNDLKCSSWLCYRGSTMAFQGMLEGLRPIYLDVDGRSDDNDPIPKSAEFRNVAATSDDLNAIISADKTSNTDIQKNIAEAVKFAKDYLSDFQPRRVVSKIREHGRDKN